MSALPWFRVQTKILDDEIVGLLDFESRWHFMALLACKGAGLLDKAYPSPAVRERAIAKKLDLDIDAFRTTLATLVEVGLVDEDAQPIGWDKHQAPADSSAARTRAYRKRKAAEKAQRRGSHSTGDGCDGHGGVTRDDVTEEVTPLDREVDRDTDTDTDRLPSVDDDARERAAEPPSSSTWRDRMGKASTGVPTDPIGYLDFLADEQGLDPIRVRSTPSSIRHAKDWHRAGVTVEQVGVAVAQAREQRQRAGDTAPPNVGLVASILAGERAANDGDRRESRKRQACAASNHTGFAERDYHGDPWLKRFPKAAGAEA